MFFVVKEKQQEFVHFFTLRSFFQYILINRQTEKERERERKEKHKREAMS